MRGIYKITNIVNNRSYIGSSKNIIRRLKNHFSLLRHNKHGNQFIQRDFNKHGINNFLYEIVYLCKDHEDILKIEQTYLDLLDYNNCYNISKNASGGDILSYHWNRRDIINKIGNTLRKKYKNGEIKLPSRNGKSNSMYIDGRSYKTKNCITCGVEISIRRKYDFCVMHNKSAEKNSFFGKKHSQETKNKISDSIKKRGYNGNQETPIAINGVSYKSLSEASKKTNIKITTIWHRIKSKNIKFVNYKYL